jgi:spore coat protein U-like protein
LAHQVARVAGTGTVSFNNCNFGEWAAGTAAIDLSGGDLVVTGCVFQKPFPQAVLQGKAQSAVITSNRLAGPFSVANTANANLQQGLNVEKKPAP